MEERSLRWNIFAKMHRSITLYVQAHFSVSHYENSFPFRLARLISWHFTLWAMSNSCGHAEVGSYAEKSRTFLTEYEAKFSAQGKNINFVRIWANGRNIAGWYFLHNQKRERKPPRSILFFCSAWISSVLSLDIWEPFSLCVCFCTEHFTGNQFLFPYLRNYRLHKILCTIQRNDEKEKINCFEYYYNMFSNCFIFALLL